ncbi:dynamin family protein [Paenibacillus sp. MER 99-2]|uniref:dynamin family protein n=1 Tax=Paenibacillus sp. MER 99-2 TaxID=2939572 RepID=UPI002040982D|nr:dynamin family protein [Paenibacillus sp. MER 99-2]MCM3174398.1 dynamin family protein [Paenibacillus sp. MER 99-2]
MVYQQLMPADSENLSFGEKLLNVLIQTPYIQNSKTISQEAAHIMDRLRDKSFKVAVVGEFSSGKSTFLNALMGKDHLAHGVKETTAAVTMLVNTHGAQQGTCRVTLNDGVTKLLNDYSELHKVTTTESSVYQVSHQVKSVELFVPIMETNVPVIFVDTPGLNGVAEMHRERTIDLIQSAHACIYMLQSRGLGTTDIETLKWIGQYQHDFIFVQNFIDEINTLEGETLKSKLEEQHEILSKKVFSGRNDVSFELCGVSAMKALAAKDTSISRLYNTDTSTLTLKDRERLYEESNFEQVMGCISRFMESSYQRVSFSALCAAHRFAARIAELLVGQFEVQNALWSKGDDAQIVERTQQLLNNWDARSTDHMKNLDNFIVSRMNEGRRFMESALTEHLETFKNRIPEIFSEIDTPDDWDTFNANKVMEIAVANDSHHLTHRLGELLSKYCENTHNLAMRRIQEYVGLVDEFSEQELPRYQAMMSDDGLKGFVQEENNIKKEESELIERQARKRKVETEQSRLRAMEQNLMADLSLTQERQQQAQNSFESRKRNLGEMPEPRSYYETVTRYEYRGGLGILDALLGPKEVTHSEKRWDYSAQNKWKEEERKLRNTFQREETAFGAQLSNLREKIRNAKENAIRQKQTAAAEAAKINRQKKIVDELMKSLQDKKNLAEKEYLHRQKMNLETNVCDYLFGTLREAIIDNIEKSIINVRESLVEEVQELYIVISNSQRENLQQMLSNKQEHGGIQLEQLRMDLEAILKVKNDLGEYLCKQQTQFA